MTDKELQEKRKQVDCKRARYLLQKYSFVTGTGMSDFDMIYPGINYDARMLNVKKLKTKRLSHAHTSITRHLR